MILSLCVKNYALIEDLSLDFKQGLTVITGETGSGKSIVIEAIELLCGKRADTSAVRLGCNVCQISGSFSFENPRVAAFLENYSISLDDNILLIRRTIEVSESSGGKSKAFINDCQVNISTLAALGELLIDFHAQDEKYSLNSLETQLEILDSKADKAKDLSGKIALLYGRLSTLRAELESLNLSDSQREQKIDMFSFQLEEIDDADLKENEDIEIEARLPGLKNAEKISALCKQIKELLYSSEVSALSTVAKAKKDIESLNSLGAEVSEALTLIDQSYYQIEEAYRGIEDISDRTDIDPEKLNAVLERAELIKKLKKKYGSSIAEIKAYRDKIESELNVLRNFQANSDELQKAIDQVSQELLALCDELTQKRMGASEKFCENVRRQLAELEIQNAVFEIDFKKKEPSANGQDKIDFMFSANKGESVAPLRNAASGGEMSRVLLAIELSADFNAGQTAVFDEIDTGTGGKAGEKIARKLSELSKQKQVFSITHLAQGAAFADTHVKIYKSAQGDRTFTKAKILSRDEHIEEIARMISGQEITQSALEHAQNLIAAAKNS